MRKGCFGIVESSIDCCKSGKLISSLSLEPREIEEEVVPVGEGLEEEEKEVKKDTVRSAEKLGNQQQKALEKI